MGSDFSDIVEEVKKAAATDRANRAIRHYAPVIGILLTVLMITIVVLPSSLNLPQSNPTEVPDYAPIPPDDENPPPITSAAGFSSLGLASSGTLEKLLGEKEDLAPEARRARSKECKSGRQTEDPNAPPCQPFFDGDNGGATWQGVTRDTITILIYQQTVITIDNNGTERSNDARTYCDIELMDCDGDGKTDSKVHVWVRVANAFLRYFNERFQTYDRKVKAYFYWSNSVAASGRRSDAADNWARYKPFAVLDQAWNGGYHEAYVDSIARRNSMVFGSFVGLPRQFYESYAPKVWAFWPDVESWAEMYSGYICNKVKGSPVNSGEFRGQERRYGLMYTTDQGYQNLHRFREEVTKDLDECGIDWGQNSRKPREYSFPYAGWAVDSQGDQSYGVRNVAEMEADQVNTILWLGGVETKTTRAAGDRSFYPEWVVAGDGQLDSNGYGQFQDQSTWQNAWVQSYQLRTGASREDFGYRAYTEAEPNGDDWDWAIGFYRDWFMLFTAIQVAGPRLTPAAVDAGLHAIQRQESTSPYVAACYYIPRNYTCVKDATEAWWDASARNPNNEAGCWRLVDTGWRYEAHRWTKGPGPGSPAYTIRVAEGKQNDPIGIADFDHKSKANKDLDPCTGYSTPQGIRPGTPGPPGS